MLWVFLILLVVVLAIGGYAVSLYNGFVKSRNLIQESWRQIDVELNRRYDLIPNLVETVRAFAAHERNTLEQVVALRSQAAQLAQASGGVPNQQRAQIEEQLSGAVRQLIVSVEAYPELKSNVNFLELQRELAATEDRIAAGRRFYNANVRNYNTQVESFPSNLLAGVFKFEKATYFEVNDTQMRQAPTVSFGEISDRGDVPRPGAEPTNAQLEAGAAAAGGLPNPQAYQQSNPLAPPPGEFPEPAPVQQQFPAPSYPPQQYPPVEQYPPAQQPEPPSYGAPGEATPGQGSGGDPAPPSYGPPSGPQQP
jgi:LemA protein